MNPTSIARMAKLVTKVGLLIIAAGVAIGAADIFRTPQLNDKVGGYGALKFGWLTEAFGLTVICVGKALSVFGRGAKRTAAAASRELGGDGDVGSASLPHAPSEASRLSRRSNTR